MQMSSAMDQNDGVLDKYTFLKDDIVTGGLKSTRAWIRHRKAEGRGRRIDENFSQMIRHYMGAIPMH